mgnify:CR=1 FL=1
MSLSNYWFTPEHQPVSDVIVRFHLKPLDQRGQYDIQATMNGNGVPSSDGLEVGLKYVIDWENVTGPDGKPLAYSLQVKRRILDGDPNINMLIWLASVTGELYRQSFMPEIERKN